MSARGFWTDIGWAIRMWRIKRYRHRLGFSQRIAFDAALRRPLRDGSVIAYPDAAYHHRAEDFEHAISVVEPERP